MQRSSSMAKRVAIIGLAAFVSGAVLLGTGIAASAAPKASAAAANNANKKKHPTTTTTTTTTLPTTSTTTQPCNGAPTTANATKGQGSATVTNGTCLVGGMTVTVAATGLTPYSATNYLGTFIECNNDPSQPTVSILGNTIPVSCSPALKYVFTPNAAGTANMPDPNAQPAALPAFSVIEGTTGPACASATGVPPGLCGGTSTSNPTPDSTGGNPYTDAANYPCPPTPAQRAAGYSCVIAVGDTGGDQVAVPISFNLLVPAPPTTVAPATQSSTATTAAAAAPAATKASSGSLAFTGSGPGLWWLALVGLLLMVFGGLLLTVVDQPRRLLRLALHRARRSRDDT